MLEEPRETIGELSRRHRLDVYAQIGMLAVRAPRSTLEVLEVLEVRKLVVAATLEPQRLLKIAGDLLELAGTRARAARVLLELEGDALEPARSDPRELLAVDEP